MGSQPAHTRHSTASAYHSLAGPRMHDCCSLKPAGLLMNPSYTTPKPYRPEPSSTPPEPYKPEPSSTPPPPYIV